MTSGGFSLKFSKSSGQKLTTISKITSRDDDDKDNTKKPSKRAKITSLDSTGFNIIEETADESVKKPLVIPALPNKFVFNLNGQQAADPKNDEERLNQLARIALLEDALKLTNGSETVTLQSELIISRQQKYVETQARSDLSELAEEADETDYETVPVESFGKALLRGLGWKEGQPIGRRVQKAVVPVITAPRPKGLGLGAAVPKSTSQQYKNSSAVVADNAEVLR